MKVQKIISGGQTGVDRAALDFSLHNKIHCGGWCPQGRLAEDGIIHIRYPLIETQQSDVIFRTQKNIDEADGTLLIYNQNMDKGTKQTLSYASDKNKPLYKIDLSKSFNKLDLKNWLVSYNIKKLNIAGPRESYYNGIYQQSYNFLRQIKELFDC